MRPGAAAKRPRSIADGVWLLRGWDPPVMNVYLLSDEGGVALFDAGIRAMADDVVAAAAPLGGITRVVLGHAHSDHRGTAPSLGVPVYCHPDEVADAQGDGGASYADWDRVDPALRDFMRSAAADWDGGPVEIAGTVSEGDDVCGFEVVDMPGHAPGQIALWRERDRLALVTDVIYAMDVRTARPGPPRLPDEAFNWDTEKARASMRRLAGLEAASIWPGHLGPVTGDDLNRALREE